MMEERPFTQKLLESEQMLYRISCALLRMVLYTGGTAGQVEFAVRLTEGGN